MVDVSRRDFIRGLAFLAVGAALSSPIEVKAASQEEVPKLPWPYVELDPEHVRKLGHLGYYAFECSAGAFWAIMVSLKEKVGYPYTLLPIPSVEEVQKAVDEGEEILAMMQFGGGGAFSWASLCGALNGAGLAINMVTHNYKKVGQRLFRWYETFPFPSDVSNELASNHQFLVKKYKSDKVLPQSVSHSVLCHVSVSRWCVASGYASGSKERSERCGRLTGDVAAMAVKLLNADLKGNLDEVFKFTLTPTTAECRTCHYKGKNYEAGQFSRGFMVCESCHKDMRPHASSIVPIGSKEKGDTSLVLSGAGASAAVGVVAGLWSYAKKKG